MAINLEPQHRFMGGFAQRARSFRGWARQSSGQASWGGNWSSPSGAALPVVGPGNWLTAGMRKRPVTW